jgi:hypothetical protein
MNPISRAIALIVFQKMQAPCVNPWQFTLLSEPLPQFNAEAFLDCIFNAKFRAVRESICKVAVGD